MLQYVVFSADVQAVQAGKLRGALTDAANSGNDVYLMIVSGGGNVFEGLNIAAFIKTLPISVTTHNIGMIDSIANLIFAAGSPRYATQNASFLFHGVTMNYEKQMFIESQLEEQYKSVRRSRESIAATFATYTGLQGADVEALMISGSTILTATEALSKSIVNEIRDAKIPPGSKIISIGNA
jgi:ATP-dependent Clp protease, protease subunit